MIKIKHGFNWFDVSPADGLKIYGVKIKLKFIRQFRRMKLLCQINEITLMLLPAWFAFLVITWLWGIFADLNSSFIDLLWEYRTDLNLTNQIEKLTEIKSESEKSEVITEMELIVNKVIDMVKRVNEFTFSVREEEKHGGLQIATLAKDFAWDWQQINESVFTLLKTLLEQIKSMVIFEKIKDLNVSDCDILNLQDRISKATSEYDKNKIFESDKKPKDDFRFDK